jgi:HPt (histidine-containing phosphotransfer) domain-containing protein
VISVERVEELKSEVGADDFAEIVALFLADAEAVIERLRTARDPAEAEELLHALKGSALNIGFDALAGLCRDGQGAAAGTPAWAARHAQLVETFERSRSELFALA